MSSMNVQEALQRVLIPSNTSLSTVTSDMVEEQQCVTNLF
jgi:hypothetical protein